MELAKTSLLAFFAAILDVNDNIFAHVHRHMPMLMRESCMNSGVSPLFPLQVPS